MEDMSSGGGLVSGYGGGFLLRCVGVVCLFACYQSLLPVTLRDLPVIHVRDHHSVVNDVPVIHEGGPI